MAVRQAAQIVHVPPSYSGKHTFGSFTSPLTTYTQPSFTLAQTQRCTLTHDNPHMLVGGSALSYLVVKASQLFKCMMQD